MASLEQGSEHPLGSAIVAAAERTTSPWLASQTFNPIPDLGSVARWTEKRCRSETKNSFSRSRYHLTRSRNTAEDLRHNGQTVVFVAVDGRPAGMIGIADPIKPSTAQALRDLKAAGLRIVMLTGDSRGTAEAVAAQAWHR